mgnify:CR=1 FL=1
MMANSSESQYQRTLVLQVISPSLTKEEIILTVTMSSDGHATPLEDPKLRLEQTCSTILNGLGQKGYKLMASSEIYKLPSP